MTIGEKVSYIKGLAEGLGLENDTKEGKVLNAIIDLLGDISDEIDCIEEDYAELCEQVDVVDEDLSAVEDFIYEDDDECDCGCGCGSDCDCGCQDGEECCCGCDNDLYEVVCPKCNDIIYLDGEMLEEEGITCPNCGTDLEFDFDGCDCCDCGCEDEE